MWQEPWKSEIPVVKRLGAPDDLWGAPNKTVLAYANAAYQHIHMPGYVYPRDGTNVDVVTSATASTYGDFVELVPADAIGAPFDTHWVNVAEISHNGTYVIQLHIVSNTAPMTSVRYLTEFSVTRLDNFTKSSQVYVQMPAIPGGSRIGVRALKGSATAGTVSLNIHYHEYE